MLRVLFHVQHLLGIGHLQRSLRIAEALIDEGVAVTLASGGFPSALPCHPAIEFVQLPPIRARDARYDLLDVDGRAVDDAYRQRRVARLLAASAAMRPDVIVIEGYPLARRAFRFELEPLLAAARNSNPRPRVVCSVRDIVVMRDDPQRHRDIVERIRRDFDAVLVHGDPALIRLDASFPAAPEIADRIIYTGYVSPPSKPLASKPLASKPLASKPLASKPLANVRGGGEVVVSAGGGAAGRSLLSTALGACRAGCLADSPWRLFSGTNLPEADFQRLRSAPPPHARIERFHDDLAGLLRGCRVSVSQAGYNTVLDILRAQAHAVVVPFAAGRETEQVMRAERLAALGAAQLLRESELTVRTLALAIERAASRGPATVAVDMNGAVQSARIIARIAASKETIQEVDQDLATTPRPSIIPL